MLFYFTLSAIDYLFWRFEFIIKFNLLILFYLRKYTILLFSYFLMQIWKYSLNDGACFRYPFWFVGRFYFWSFLETHCRWFMMRIRIKWFYFRTNASKWQFKLFFNFFDFLCDPFLAGLGYNSAIKILTLRLRKLYFFNVGFVATYGSAFLSCEMLGGFLFFDRALHLNIKNWF